MTVINLEERMKPIQPKTETRFHNGHRFHLTFDPNAPIGKQWVWRAIVTRTYEFVGEAATIQTAASQAKRRINTYTRVWGDEDG